MKQRQSAARMLHCGFLTPLCVRNRFPTCTTYTTKTTAHEPTTVHEPTSLHLNVSARFSARSRRHILPANAHKCCRIPKQHLNIFFDELSVWGKASLPCVRLLCACTERTPGLHESSELKPLEDAPLHAYSQRTCATQPQHQKH